MNYQIKSEPDQSRMGEGLKRTQGRVVSPGPSAVTQLCMQLTFFYWALIGAELQQANLRIRLLLARWVTLTSGWARLAHPHGLVLFSWGSWLLDRWRPTSVLPSLSLLRFLYSVQSTAPVYVSAAFLLPPVLFDINSASTTSEDIILTSSPGDQPLP